MRGGVSCAPRDARPLDPQQPAEHQPQRAPRACAPRRARVWLLPHTASATRTARRRGRAVAGHTTAIAALHCGIVHAPAATALRRDGWRRRHRTADSVEHQHRGAAEGPLLCRGSHVCTARWRRNSRPLAPNARPTRARSPRVDVPRRTAPCTRASARDSTCAPSLAATCKRRPARRESAHMAASSPAGTRSPLADANYVNGARLNYYLRLAQQKRLTRRSETTHRPPPRRAPTQLWRQRRRRA